MGNIVTKILYIKTQIFFVRIYITVILHELLQKHFIFDIFKIDKVIN